MEAGFSLRTQTSFLSCMPLRPIRSLSSEPMAHSYSAWSQTVIRPTWASTWVMRFAAWGFAGFRFAVGQANGLALAPAPPSFFEPSRRSETRVSPGVKYPPPMPIGSWTRFGRLSFERSQLYISPRGASGHSDAWLFNSGKKETALSDWAAASRILKSSRVVAVENQWGTSKSIRDLRAWTQTEAASEPISRAIGRFGDRTADMSLRSPCVQRAG